MNNTYRKISRGQVWFLIDNMPDSVYNQTSVQGKNRPWLFVSNNMCNQSSPVYTAVPLTTQPKNSLPTHVNFRVGDKENTVLCEQLRSIPHQMVMANGSYYMFTLSEDLMRDVDEALSIQLGLQIIFPNNDRYWESLSRLIRAKVKEAVASSHVNNIDIGKVATLLEDRVDNIVREETTPAKPIETSPIAEEKSGQVEQTEPIKTWVPHKPTKPRNKWTTEGMKTFLSDCDKYTPKDVCEKYKMTLKTLYVTKSKFKKLLNENA